VEGEREGQDLGKNPPKPQSESHTQTHILFLQTHLIFSEIQQQQEDDDEAGTTTSSSVEKKKLQCLRLSRRRISSKGQEQAEVGGHGLQMLVPF
jgi:hypothetical protein